MSGFKRNCCGARNLRIALVLFGGFLIHLTLGSLYTIGNFAPYFISYIRNRTDNSEIRNVDSLWIIASGSIGNCIGLTVGGIFAHRFGARKATFIGAIVFCGSVASTYFSVNQSFIALAITYGLLLFLGQKVMYGTTMQTAIKWLPGHSTLAAGLILGGTGCGTLIFNQMVTGYINPDNLSQDLTTKDGDRYFTQPELLDRVPTYFLVMGATIFGMQLIGIACLSEPSTTHLEITIGTVEPLKNWERSRRGLNISTVQLKQYATKDEVSGDYKESQNGSVMKYENEAFQDTENLDKTAADDKTLENKDYKISEDNSGPEQLGVLQAIKFALRCRSFYILWLTIMLIYGGMQFINSLYKVYGVTFIDDDHFLALVGSLGAIFLSIGLPFWGVVMDRAGFRVAIRCVSGGFVIAMATLLVTEHLPKDLFLVWICTLYFFYGGIWSIMPSTLAKLLGPEHMAINYGIIFTGLSVASILGSIFGTSLKAEIGWHGLFFMAAGLGVIVFLLSFLFNGVDRYGKRI